ncbi:MAG: HEAT repeat domain-containing protein [Candidatus Zixiibacteriota bacterium]|nr:MAG: HEAT repeat domain-containing protein [candidate division Zixibacteria bacterium]
MSEMLQIDESDFIEIDEAQVRSVAEAFNQLIKTVKAKLVYPSSSKLPGQFVDKLFNDFTALLGDIEKLKLKIEADSVLFSDQVIYKAASKTDNFAHPFFRDGIIELEFDRDLPFEEFEKFVDTLALITRSAHVEDDLATLLWEIGFEKISYRLMDDSLDLETFEYGTSMIKTPLESSGVDYSEVFLDESNLGLTDEDFDLESEKNKARKLPAGYRNVPDNVADYITGLSQYDESEKSAIAELIKSDENFECKQYIIDILFEILGAEGDNASYNETLELISKVRDDFIKVVDIQSAITILNMTKELQEALKNLGDDKEKKIGKFIKSFGASERIRVMVDMLNNSKDINYSGVTEYLTMLSWEAITPLIWALGELNHYPARRAVCQALETIAADHVDVLGKGTENPRWYVVRNVIMILGKIGSTKALNYFQRTITHSDIRVRKETVVSAAKINNEQSADFLIMALKDESESLQTLALKELVKRKSVKAFIHVEHMIEDKKFKNRPADQIKEILEAYARLGGRDAFEKLKRMATRTILIPSEKEDRIKFYAVMAIGCIQSASAYQILDKISRSRNKNMADGARRAMNRMKKEKEIVK